MSPGILYIYPGLIVPIRFTISIALFFIAVKANVVAFYQGRDWSECPGHPLLLATALINSILSGLSLILSLIRDEDKLPPRVRWNCAAIGAVVRFFLFQLTLSTAIKTANNGLAGSFRLNEFVLAEVTLSLLLVCLFVGVIRKIRSMRAAHDAGEEEVQKELARREEQRLTSPTTSTNSISSPESLPMQLLYDSDDHLLPTHSESSMGKGELAAKFTVTLVNTRNVEYVAKDWEPETPKLQPFRRL